MGNTVTESENVIIDVIPPRNFSENGKFDEAEIIDLFTRMLENAGFTGRYTVRAEELIKGSPGKANTVRFQARPVGASGMFLLYVNWQGAKPDSAFKGTLLSADEDPREMHARLGEVYPTQTFVLSRDGVTKQPETVEEVIESNLFTDESKFRRAAKQLCNLAEQDEHCFLTTTQIEAIVKPIYPRIEFGSAKSISELLSARGYIDPFDANDTPERRFFVEPALFHIAGMVHPDHRRSVPKPPPQPKPVVEEPQSSSGGRGMGAIQLLKELRELRRKVAATEGMQEEIDILLKEKNDLEREIKKAEYRIQAIDRDVKEKREQMNDPEIVEARDTLAEFESLLK